MEKSSLVYWLNALDYLLWSKCLVLLLVVLGLILTFRLGGMQFRYLVYALKLAFTRKDNEAQGDISQFQALMTTLAATIGIGSIAGVATAIVSGGFGAIFWMWVIALVGMVTKFAEAILAIKFRIVDERGRMCGGPMYYISKGLGWKWMAVAFAAFGALSAFAGGNMIQAHSIASAMQGLFDLPVYVTGGILTLASGIVILGGIKNISKVSAYLVPFMALMYVIGGLFIVFFHWEKIPSSLSLIVKSAFTGQAAFGGFMGASVLAAIQLGVARGVSSNEAGLGSAPIAAAAAKTDVPGRHALISMTGVFLSTLVVCTITALVIGVTGVLGSTGPDGLALNGAQLVMAAFKSVIPGGGAIVAVGIILFGYTTIIGWAYYGEKCVEFLAGDKIVRLYRLIFCFIVFFGAIASFDVVWPLADIMNGLMALPNVLALFALTPLVVAESKIFFIFLQKERLSLQKNAQAAE